MKKLAPQTKRRIPGRNMSLRRGKRSGPAAGFEHALPQAIEFESLAENVGLNICRYDLKCRLRYMNARVAELLGVERDKVI
jgi:PAS domain-containing protein